VLSFGLVCFPLGLNVILRFLILYVFLTGIQSVWVKRAQVSTRDNWRNDLRTLSLGNCYTVSPLVIDTNKFPLLGTIAASFDRFRTVFYDTDTNFRESYILNNKKLLRGERDYGILDKNFFDANIPRLNLEQVSNLKMKDFFRGNVFKSLDEIILDTGIYFSLLTYMRLRESLMLFQMRNPNKMRGQVAISLDRFFNVKNGEAKKIRTMLDNADKNVPVLNLRPVKTFFRLTNLEPTEELTRKIFGFWNKPYLTNKFRDFSFKYSCGKLALNTRLSHFVANRARECSLCVASNLPVPSEETFKHLFFDCNVSGRVHRWFIAKYYGMENLSNDELVKYIFTGSLRGVYNECFHLTAMTVNYLIWELKLQKRILCPLTIDNEFGYLVKNNICVSPRLKRLFYNLGETNRNIMDRFFNIEHGDR
jgi:hypothetical protein